MRGRLWQEHEQGILDTATSTPRRLALTSIFLLLVALSAGCGSTTAGPADASAGPMAGGSRPVPIIYRPPGLSRAKRVPLLVALHASGGSPAGFESKTGLDAVAAKHGFVIAYLGSVAPASPSWTATELPVNLAYVSSEIKHLTKSENIDPRRVYVTGFSAGATMSFYVGCQLSRQVDGIAPVSGAMRFTDPCRLSHPVSELLIIGTNEVIPINGTARLLSASQVAALWRRKDGCSAASSAARAGPVAQTIWGHCKAGTAVGLYTVAGGTHQFPGGPGATGADAGFDAANAIWAFFASHR